jgi:hypothetical protein
MAKNRPSLEALARPELARPAAADVAQPVINMRARHPSLTVYLPPKAIRRLKEISLDSNRRLTDLLAEAVDEWLVKRGHPSLTDLR